MNKQELVKKLRVRYEELLTQYEESKKNYTDKDWKISYYLELIKNFELYKLVRLFTVKHGVHSELFSDRSVDIKSELLKIADKLESVDEYLLPYKYDIKLEGLIEVSFEGYLIRSTFTECPEFIIDGSESTINDLNLGDPSKIYESDGIDHYVIDYEYGFNIINGVMGVHLFKGTEFLGTGFTEETGVHDTIHNRHYINHLLINPKDYED